MDIIAAYQQVGTYRGAAEACGTGSDRNFRRLVAQVKAE